jgi:drug/metabolite transporter (DMT)-like permease
LPDAPQPRALTETGAGNVAGILLVLSSYALLSGADAAAKWILPVVGVTGAMWARGVFGSLTLLAMNRGASLWPRRPWLVALRSALHCGASAVWYWSWGRLALADTYAIGFAAPLVMTLLAWPMLGERLRWRRMASTAVGFLGVLVIVRPGGDLFVPEAAALLATTVVLAASRILTRTLSRTESAERITFWLMAAHIPGGFVTLLMFPLPDAWPTLAVLAGCVIMGASNGVAHWLMAQAFARAPVGVLAPYEYSMLIWGTLLGFLIFADIPAWSTLGGAAIVVAAGLYNLHRERVRRRLEAGG